MLLQITLIRVEKAGCVKVQTYTYTQDVGHERSCRQDKDTHTYMDIPSQWNKLRECKCICMCVYRKTETEKERV